MRVYFDPAKLREVTDYLANMKVRVADLTVPLYKGAKRAHADTLKDFDTSGAFSGEVWAPIAEATRKRDRYKDVRVSAMGRPTSLHRPLMLSGRFRSSVRFFAGKFEAGLTLGPAYWLNFSGTKNPNTGATKNPAREAGYISKETIDWTINAILTYAVDLEEAA